MHKYTRAGAGGELPIDKNRLIVTYDGRILGVCNRREKVQEGGKPHSRNETLKAWRTERTGDPRAREGTRRARLADESGESCGAEGRWTGWTRVSTRTRGEERGLPVERSLRQFERLLQFERCRMGIGQHTRGRRWKHLGVFRSGAEGRKGSCS